jgi:CheY-like chemotaxis protein
VLTRLQIERPAAAAQSPFLGRAEQLEALRAAYSAARSQPVVVLVQGGSGIGKSARITRDDRAHGALLSPRIGAAQSSKVLAVSAPRRPTRMLITPIAVRSRSAILRLLDHVKRIISKRNVDKGLALVISPVVFVHNPVLKLDNSFTSLKRKPSLFSHLKQCRPSGMDSMSDGERVGIVLVAAREDLLSNLREALAETNLALLHASTKEEALALLERLKSDIDLAVIQLELPDLSGWDLIKQLTWLPQRPVKIIATTSVFPEPFFGKVRELGVDEVVQSAIPPEAWRKTVEAVLGKNGNAL